MPTPSAYNTAENYDGPHTEGDKYIQSFGNDFDQVSPVIQLLAWRLCTQEVALMMQNLT